MSSCVGSGNIISLWYMEKQAVIARKAWSVCLISWIPHLPCTTQTTETMTLPLPCAVKTHTLLSAMSSIYNVPVISCTSVDLFLIVILLCLDCGMVLPHMPPACGDTSHSKQSTAENRTWEAKEGRQRQQEVPVKQKREIPPSI